MKITVTKTEAEFDREVAWRIVAAILGNPEASIGLAAGSTCDGIYQAVSKIHRDNPFDITRAIFFGVDEIVQVPMDFAESCVADFRRDLFGPCGVPEENVIMPPCQAEDYNAEARRFDERVAALAPVDLQLLGLGPDGHIAMNLPGDSFGSVTRFVPLSGELDARIRKLGGLSDEAPLGGETLGIRTIMNMPRLLLAAKGSRKAAMAKQALFGPVTEAVPASVLQLHPNLEVVLDAEAAAQL